MKVAHTFTYNADIPLLKDIQDKISSQYVRKNGKAIPLQAWTDP
jgi:hypothetical protein